MSQNTQVVNFVRIKSWYIPADAESYLLLKSINFPLCKVNSSMLPALQLAMQPKGIRAKAESFADSVLHPYFDKLGEVWNSKEGRKCKITDSKMSFHAPSTKKNKEAIRKLDDSLTRFFARWGFSYAPVYSDDGNGKCKLTVEFRFDQNKTPVIPTVDTTPPDCVEFILGFTKLKITFGRRREANPYGERQSHLIVAKQVGVPFHLLEVYNQAGADWVMVHSSTFVDNTVGDVKPWLETMAQLAVAQATLNPQ